MGGENKIVIFDFRLLCKYICNVTKAQVNYCYE